MNHLETSRSPNCAVACWRVLPQTRWRAALVVARHGGTARSHGVMLATLPASAKPVKKVRNVAVAVRSTATVDDAAVTVRSSAT